jgi:hypothetical protein
MKITKTSVQYHIGKHTFKTCVENFYKLFTFIRPMYIEVSRQSIRILFFHAFLKNFLVELLRAFRISGKLSKLFINLIARAELLQGACKLSSAF